MAEFFDTHAHLDFAEFAGDLNEVLGRAKLAGINRILTIGTSLESSRRAVALAEHHAMVYAVVGVHPNHVREEAADITGELRALAAHPKVVAVGETGLDFHRQGELPDAERSALREKQHRLFEQQLSVAAETGLNCVIHQREAFRETLEILTRHRGRVKGVFHCFSGTPLEAMEVLESGSLVSFTGIATFRNAQSVRDTVAAVPLGRFMLETDCPFLAPVPHRGGRCEPAFVRDLAEAVALVKGCSLEELSAATCTTARAFFPRLS